MKFIFIIRTIEFVSDDIREHFIGLVNWIFVMFFFFKIVSRNE